MREKMDSINSEFERSLNTCKPIGEIFSLHRTAARTGALVPSARIKSSGSGKASRNSRPAAQN